MSIDFYAAEVDGNVLRWVQELDSYSLHLSDHNASWLLGLIGIDYGNPDYCGHLTLDEAEELLEQLADNMASGYEPSWSEKNEGEPLLIHCGRSREQAAGYYKHLANLLSAARDNGVEVIAYA